MLELHRRHKTSVVLHNMNYMRHKYKQGKPARPEWDRNVREILTFRQDGDREDKGVNFYS